MDYTIIPNDDIIQKTAEALALNGIQPIIVDTSKEAKDKVLSLIPKGAEVFNAVSATLDTIGIPREISESGDYNSVRNMFSKLDKEKDHKMMQQFGAAPEYVVGSVHAVTHGGNVLIASNTGSQLPAYAYGSDHVIWVVGVQKIVPNIEEAMKRIYEYVLPLESEHARKAYGSEGSNVSKLLIINKEVKKDRMTMILVKEHLGF